MYTNKPIRLHSKCLQILDLIQEANNRIQSLVVDLNRFDKADWLAPIRLANHRWEMEDRIERTKAIKEYLVSKYSTAMLELLSETTRSMILSSEKKVA